LQGYPLPVDLRADTVSLDALDAMDTISDICGWFVERFGALCAR
jgi:hypothetical protein